MDTAKGRYYYNADRTALVHEGDPEAAFFAVAVGDDMPEGFKAPKGPAPADAAEDAEAVLAQRAEEERTAKEGHVPTKTQARAAAKEEGT